MRYLGVIRKLDELGRVVIPMEYRKEMGLEPGTPLEIFSDGRSITFSPYKQRCICCGSDIAEELATVGNTTLCRPCISKFWGA